MKLFKFDYAGNKGDNVITVPTDSQFLIGIGNGDQQAEAQLFDGTTEILPEDAKIGEYTCFRMETQGTQFRKPYKAVINGYNGYLDAHSYDISYDDKSTTIAIVDGNVFGSGKTGALVPPGDDTMTVRFKDANGKFLDELVYTYNTVNISGGYVSTIWDAPSEIPEEISAAYPIPLKFRMQAGINRGWNVIQPRYVSGTSSAGWVNTNLVADIVVPDTEAGAYTQNIDLFIICKKMSVAYRDENMSPEEAVEAVKESGEFVGKNEDGQYEAIGPFNIIPGNGKNGSLSIFGAAPDYATGIELDMDEENEWVKAFGTIFCADLTLLQPTFDKFILTSPNGSRWVVTVDNTGALGVSAED